MILLDYSAVAIASMMVSIKKEGELLNEKFALHMILNSIRKANAKFSKKFGTMVICCDDKKNWRTQEFEFYKYKRKRDRKNSDIDWKLIYKCLDYTKDTLIKDFPYNVVAVDNAEADDIIGALSVYATDESKPTVIVSNDKDFIQLHSDFVCQFRPMEQAYVRHPEPKIFLKELILRGDADDGIPNIKSPDNHFTLDGKRQKPMYTKDVDIWKYDESNSQIPEEFINNYYRNKQLIDLTFTPQSIKDESIQQFVFRRQRANKPKMTKFFMKHQLRYLHERINDFV